MDYRNLYEYPQLHKKLVTHWFERVLDLYPDCLTDDEKQTEMDNLQLLFEHIDYNFLVYKQNLSDEANKVDIDDVVHMLLPQDFLWTQYSMIFDSEHSPRVLYSYPNF